jgi:hypothetical protein
MRFSKEQENKYLAIVRNTLRFKPDATLVELQRQLERTIKHEFTLGYISKLRKKVVGAQTHSLDNKTKKGVIAQFFDTTVGLRNSLLPIITDGDLEVGITMAAKRQYYDMLERSIRILLLSGVLDDEKGQEAFKKLRTEKTDIDARAETVLPHEEIEAMDTARLNSDYVLPDPNEKPPSTATPEEKPPEPPKKNMRWFPDWSDPFQQKWSHLEVDDDGNPIKK